MLQVPTAACSSISQFLHEYNRRKDEVLMNGEDGHHDPSLGPVDPNGKGCGCIVLFMVYIFLLPIIANPELWGNRSSAAFRKSPYPQ